MKTADIKGEVVRAAVNQMKSNDRAEWKRSYRQTRKLFQQGNWHMTRERLISRYEMVDAVGNVIREGRLTHAEWVRLAEAKGEIVFRCGGQWRYQTDDGTQYFLEEVKDV